MYPLLKHKSIFLYVLLLVAILLAACGPSAEELAATSAAETEAAIPTDTPEPEATNTPEPTATEEPTATPEPTETPLPKPAAIVGENGVSIREGPGSVYGQAGTADAGREMDVLGQALDCEWIEVRLIGVGQGWVLANSVELNVPCEGLEEAAIPPTPSGAVAGPTSTSGDGDSSGDSGGNGGCTSNETGVRINNKTGENATMSMSGPCSYFFTIPPGNGFRIFVVPGQYTITYNYCGYNFTDVHAINSKWYLDLKC